MKINGYCLFFTILTSICFQMAIIPEAQSMNVQLIVHPDVSDTISVSDIRNIFLGKKTQWKSNQSIRFVLLTEKTTYQSFITHYVGKTLYQYRNYWRKKVFTGTGMMPIMFSEVEKSIDYVRRTKGAISYIPASQDVSDGVKILVVD